MPSGKAKKRRYSEGLPRWYQQMVETVAYLQKHLADSQKDLDEFDKLIAQGYDMTKFDWDGYGIPCHFIDRAPIYEWIEDFLNFIYYVEKFTMTATWYFHHLNKLETVPAPEPHWDDDLFEEMVEPKIISCPDNSRMET